MIKIPELENYANQSIEVIVVLKPNKKQKRGFCWIQTLFL
jgi:hypothetical protein